MASNVSFPVKVAVPTTTPSNEVAVPKATVPGAHTSASEGAAAPPPAETKPADSFGTARQAETGVATVTVELTGVDPTQLPGGVVLSLEALEVLQMPDFFNTALAAKMAGLGGEALEGKAAQLMEFLAPYGARLATLDKSASLTAQQRDQVSEHFIKSLANVGLASVVEVNTQRTGLQVARGVLSVREAEDAHKAVDGLKFERKETVGTASPAAKGEAQVTVQNPVTATTARARTNQEDESRPRDKGQGSWSGLHRMRSLFGRIEDGEKWVPDEKAIFSAGLVALILSIGVAALLSLFR